MMLSDLGLLGMTHFMKRRTLDMACYMKSLCTYAILIRIWAQSAP